MFSYRSIPAVLVAATMVFLIGCSNDARPKEQSDREALDNQASTTLQKMEAEDSDLREFINRGVGYVNFPSVGEGALIVGGASGQGLVYHKGQQIGWARIEQASVGAQVGGQTYAELIVFENEDALRRFKNNDITMGANAAAVALKAGAAKSASFNDGLAVFVMPHGGAMVKANIAGQRFVYTPLSGESSTD